MQKRRGVSVTEIIILILLALALAVLAWRNESWGEGVRILLMLGAIVFLALAIAASISWIQYNAAVIDEQRQRAASLSERVQYALALAHLDPAQLAAIGKMVPAVEVISGNLGPVYLWRCMGGSLIPRSFIRRYFEMGTETDLYPVRNLGDDERSQAMDLIADMAQRGWCNLPAGNRPAVWVDRGTAEYQIFGGEA